MAKSQAPNSAGSQFYITINAQSFLDRAYTVFGAVTSGKGVEWGLSLATPVIVKYRDSRTDTRTELEAWIR